MKIILLLCSLLMSATAYHGGPFIKHTTVELAPNIKQIDQAPSGGHLTSENDIGINIKSTTSPDISSSQDDIGQKVHSGDIDEDILQLIFGSDNVTGVESSTTQFSEADLIVRNCSESTQHNVNEENSGVGQIDVRYSNNTLCFQNISEHGQYGQGFQPGALSRGPVKNLYGFENNTNVGYNSVGFSSTTNLIPSGQKTGEVSTTPSSEAGTKSSQPNQPGNQGGQNMSPTYPVNQGGSSQPGVNQGGSTWPGLSPTYSVTRSGNQGGSTQPGLNPTHSITRPNKNSGGIQPGLSPTYPILQPGNQGPVYWPYIGLNPTEVPISQGSVPTIIPGYWPYVQYSGYYSPDFVPGQGSFTHHGWVGNSQGNFYSYPSNGPQYGWPYTQDPLTYGSGWFGFGGQEARPYNYNHDGLNGQEHQQSHHHQPGGEHHGHHFYYNHNRGY